MTQDILEMCVGGISVVIVSLTHVADAGSDIAA
jgi:hypothetical protein